MENKPEVIVVGSGPSGSTAAKYCSEKGLNVLLIEKEKLPRYKTCGGAVSQKALDEVGKIDSKIIERECYGARIYTPSSSYFEEKLDKRIAILTFRDSFDYFLSQKAQDAGTIINDCERVKGVKFGQENVTVLTDKNEYSCNIVIGADGVNSKIAKESKIRNNWNSKVGLGLEAEIKLNDNVVENLMEDPQILEFYFLGFFWGYGWIFPKKDHLSIGIGSLLSTFKNSKEIFNKFIANISKLKGYDFNIESTRAHMIPVGGIKRKVCTDRTLLVGDAAGFVDPFLGEGIYYSIKSGKIAGKTIVDAHEAGRFNSKFLHEYQESCNKEIIDKDLKWALRFANLTYNHLNLFLRALEKDRTLFKKYLRTVMGDMYYNELIKWSAFRLPVTLSKLI